MKLIFIIAILALCLCSCSNDNSSLDCGSLQTNIGSATLKVSPSGDSSYTVQGTAMNGVAGIQLSITYDAASLVNPTVTQGDLVSGAMFAANTSTPGLIKIAIISTRAFSGSGQIAAISFASKSGSGGISSITTEMIDSIGRPLSGTTAKKANKSVGAAVSVTPAGEAQFYIQGTEMDGISGIQLNISYDSASLANPTVTLGNLVSGAMFVAYTANRGSIQIAIISTRAFSGSGQIAAISFASKTGSGSISLLSSSMINSTGLQISAQSVYSSLNSTTGANIAQTQISEPMQSSIPVSITQITSGVTSTASTSCR